MKLVQWYDGSYGVVKGWISKKAVGHNGFWWSTKQYWPEHCKFSTKEAALKAANMTTYKVIE